MCYRARIDNETSDGLAAKTSNVSWAVFDDEVEYLAQGYYEATPIDIMFFCPENKTIFKFEKTSPWPVNLH